MVINFCGRSTEVLSLKAAQKYVLSWGGSRFTHNTDEWLWDRWSKSWIVRRLPSIAPERAINEEDRSGLRKIMEILSREN